MYNKTEKRVRKTYFYTIKEISLDAFKQKYMYSFCDAYHKIFLTKAAYLIDNPDQKIMGICACKPDDLNRKITGHVLNAKAYAEKMHFKFDLVKFFDLFSITWKVKIEPASVVQIIQTLGSDHELLECKNIYKMCWRFPAFEEKKDPEGKSYWIKTGWHTFDTFFDMDELQDRIGIDARFRNEAKITMSRNRVTIALGYDF